MIDLKKKFDERYFVPWDGFVGLISKAWDELTPEEREIAVPVSSVYNEKIKFQTNLADDLLLPKRSDSAAD